MVTTRRGTYNAPPRPPRRRRAPAVPPPAVAPPAVAPPAVANTRHRPRDAAPYTEQVVTHTRRKGLR